MIRKHPEKMGAGDTRVTVDNSSLPVLKGHSQSVALLLQHAIRFVAEDSRPLRVFESVHLKKMFALVRPGSEMFLPSHSLLSESLIPQAAAAVQGELQSLFGPSSPGNIPGVLAFDGWSSDANDSFLAIFVYFERGQGVEVRLLGVKNLDAGHGASAMANVIQQVLQPYPHLTALAAVADTTRVNPATCKELGIEFFPCMIHVLQLSVKTIITCKSDNPIGPLL